MNKTEDNNNSIKMTVEAYSRVQVLAERFDRHLNSIDQQHNYFNNKLDTLKSDLSNFKIDVLKELRNMRELQINDDRATNTKIYTINGIIAFLVSFFTAWFESKHGR